MTGNRGLRLILLLLFMTVPAAGFGAPVIIGIVTDGPLKRPVVPIETLRDEITDLTRGEFDVRLPPEKIVSGDWTVPGIRAALESQLADREVDIIITLGLLASHEASKIENPRKPVIAPIVVDVRLQRFPVDGDSSGRHNFTYIASFHQVEDEILTFRDVVRFDHLGLMINRHAIDGIPAIAERAREIARDTGLTISAIPVGDSVDEALASIPPGVEAVYITPLLHIDEAEFKRLADGLIERKLPSFSLLGRSEVAMGIMVASGGLPADQTRFARRLALNLQSILLGRDAGTLSVAFPTNERLTINMQTAKAIGFYPRWAILTDADKLHDEELDSGPPLTLVGAMSEAIETNLNLRTAATEVDVVGEDVNRARSALLPQVGIGAGYIQIDADTANPLGQPEKTGDVAVVGSQLIYSDDAWASYKISQYLQDSAEFDYKSVVLDTMQSAADAYLTYLRTRALEGVLASNVEVTRVNLDLARRREAVGFSGRDEVLRWESQIARDRQNLLAAQADRRAGAVEVNRVLNRAQDKLFSTPQSDIDKLVGLIIEENFQRFVDNPGVWVVFQNFMVDNAVAEAPELKGIDSLISAQERDVKRGQRSYYVPDVTLEGNASNNIDRSGAGTPSLFLQDDTWRISLQATLPLYQGSNRRAELSQSRYGLQQLTLRRADAAQNIEARTRASLHQIGGSYPAIELSRAAADAASENLGLMTDKYVRGTVSVTALIDAQDAALSAELDAAEAEYTFLIDLVEVMRSGSDFGLFLDPAYGVHWYNEIETYFREHGEDVPGR